MNGCLIVEFELDILDGEGPDIVTEAVCVEVTLEGEPGLDTIGDGLDEGFVEVGDDLHGELRFDLVAADEVVEGICERGTDAAGTVELVEVCAGRHFVC